MALDIIIDNITKTQWQNYAKDFADYSIYQTWAYQEVRAQMAKQQLSRFVIKDGTQAAAMGQMRIMHVRPLGLKIGYVQWGPLLRGKDGEVRCSADALSLLRKAYLGARVNILRLVPNVCDGESGQRIVQMLQSGGFETVPRSKPYHTIIVPLEVSEEKLRQNLRQKWRNRLNKAEKSGLEIRQGINGEYFTIFESLYRLTVERKNFAGLDVEVFKRSQQMLDESEKMNSITAYHDGQPVTSNVSSCLGDTAVVLFVAGNDEGLKYGGNNLTWWQAFLSAQQAGMKNCDLGGIDPINNPGVYHFKDGVGGKEVFHIGTFEACTGNFIRGVWRLAERLHTVIKGRR
jgi:lipid II:glycine glycyltransferase (peptidoglycan interpeptide bridge formation enzyme)